MKKSIFYLIILGLSLLHVSCAKGSGENTAEEHTDTTKPLSAETLVVYFSQTGTTEGVARMIADITGGDT